VKAGHALVDDLQSVLNREPIDLARAALVAARIEQPALDPGPSLDRLARLGERAGERLSNLTHPTNVARVSALNSLLFEQEGFAGNRAHYDDYRNSLLNVVLDRRLGIPITLALVYMDVGRRAGVDIDGVAFPGHFLMHVPANPDRRSDDDGSLIVDPFDAGKSLDEKACQRLLAVHVGADADAAVDAALLRPCPPRYMLTRLLNNLKRAYIDARSFPQARMVIDLMLVVDPALHSERRDRGLVAYHLDDFPAALRDLEDYLKLNRWPEGSDHKERDQVWEHVKTLRRRVAGLN
jgi:regulator of sirC expression with transglutaminase-like and TPR domain